MSRAILSLLVLPLLAPAASYYTRPLDDPKAVYLEKFSPRADGVADDTAALQQAIDQVQETTGHGVLLIPEGRYRFTRTLYVWPGVRLIGYGPKRPVFLLAPNTPGYQDSANENYMVFFTGGRARGAQGSSQTPPRDAGAGTFYSAISNIDIEIGDGNPGAVGIRGRYAQHAFMAHMDFRIGSGLAGVHETGNVAEDVHFYGGQYGIWTQKPSPGWQFTVVDATFEGQREAAIREREAGLTLIRPTFKNVPTAISIESGFPDELWIKDARMEDISGPAVIISLEQNPRTEINMENVVCRRVPVFAQLRESGKKFSARGEMYEVKAFSHGLNFPDMRAKAEIKAVFETSTLTALPAPPPSDLPDLPARDSWINVHSLGAKGDGKTDDTAVLRAAIAAHRTLYFPMGRYVISDTLQLRPDTVLIGLHPDATQILLLDGTPAFQGVGGPKPMIEAPQGGTNIVIGLGIYTNGVNPRALAAKWMAGSASIMNDVRFLGGHGTSGLDGRRENPYNNTHTADPVLNRRWDGQYPSLWVTNGGGGTFFDIWTPSSFASAGMLISDTNTEGRIYEMSSEHHVRYEVQLRNVSNWKIYALQTESERGESPFSSALEIENSNNITVANFHIYRVISSYQPFPYAIKVTDSRNIRFRNLHCYSNSKVSYDAAVRDATHGLEIRQREFAWLTHTGAAPAALPAAPSSVLVPGARVEKLAGGFQNISGGAVHPNGDFYFVDARFQRIYRWSVSQKKLSIVRDNPLDPTNLAFDKAGNLLVVSYSGNGVVYSLKPDAPGLDIAVLKAEPSAPRPGAAAVLPVSDWRVNHEAFEKPSHHYLSPDGTVFIPAGNDFISGALSWGIKSSALLRGFGLASAAPGQPAYITSESEIRTWTGTVNPDGSLSALKPFVENGGEGVAVDASGNVYIAAGHIYVYNPAGKLIDTIEVPERPTQLVFGGKDSQTLFIPARTSLYAIRVRFTGR